MSAADDIREYKQLLDEGVITQEDFDAKKKELLRGDVASARGASPAGERVSAAAAPAREQQVKAARAKLDLTKDYRKAWRTGNSDTSKEFAKYLKSYHKTCKQA